MYEKRFSLQRRPFPTTPDGSLYYPATEHEASLARMQRALGENEGFALLTGPVGIGKTLLGMQLIDKLGPDAVSAFLTNSHFPDRRGLLQAVLFDLGLPHDQPGEQLLRLRLTEYLLKNCAEGKKTVLLIDEAQNLTADHLEELRLLGNLEAGSARAVQVVLLGQPPFLDLLRRPQLASLRQRLAIRLALVPLGLEESLDYLVHHLRLAGGRPERIMDEAALEVLARGAHGIPRLLNQAAHHALMLADAGDLPWVDAEAALEALTVLGLDEENPAAVADNEEIKELENARRGHAFSKLRQTLEEDQEELTVGEPGLRLAEETRRPA